MALSLPWPYVGGIFDKPKDLNDLADKVQQNLDAISKQFPVGGGNVQKVPQARAYNSGNQSVNNNTLTAVTFDSETFDSGTSSEQHSTSSNTSRLTCRVAGLYAITGCVTWDANSTGTRGALIRHGGSTYLAGDVAATAPSPDLHRCSVTTFYRLAVDEYVELVGFQTSGGALNALGGDIYTSLCWYWISP